MYVVFILNYNDSIIKGGKLMINEMESYMEEIEKSMRVPRRGEIITGKVINVTNSEIAVNIGYKSDGIIPKEEISNDYSVNPKDLVSPGDEIKVYVINSDDGEGNVLLSKKRVDMEKGWDELQKILEEESLVEARVTEAVRSGVIALARDIRCFIPASQLSDRYVSNLDEFVGKSFNTKVIEIDRQKNKVILSRKAVLAEENKKNRKEMYSTLEKGQVLPGTVRQLTNFGAFVDLGGVDGLVHISELSWGRVKHPSEILQIGDVVNVEILDFDKEKDKVSLSIKSTQTAPWDNIDKEYNVGDIVEGTVVRLADFGAFVELKPGLDGLIHISQISTDRITKPAEKLKTGEILKVKILDINPADKRISLSITAINEVEEEPIEYNNDDTPITIGDIINDSKNKES